MIHRTYFSSEWPQVPLGRVCEITIGRTPSRSEPKYWQGEFPWLSIADMNQGRLIESTKELITHKGVMESGSRLIEKGTVLLSFKLSIGKVSIAGLNLYTNEAIAACIIRDPNTINRDYLYWTLKSIHLEDEVDKAVKGKTLNKEKLENLILPLPPIVTQKRIAYILDKADAIRRKRRQALRLTDDYLRSVFLDMFGDPLTNTHQLPMRPLRDFGEIVTGNTPPRSEPENYGEAIEWIKSDNINTPSYYLTTASERLSSIGAAKARRVPANSILVTCIAGSPSCIGNVAVTDREVAFNQQINAVVPFDSVDPGFLFTQFLVGKKKIQNASTNGMKGMVSKGTFSEIEFIAPTIDKQREFGRIFRVLKDLQRKSQEAFNAEELLFASLQQRAFSGQL